MLLSLSFIYSPYGLSQTWSVHLYLHSVDVENAALFESILGLQRLSLLSGRNFFDR